VHFVLAIMEGDLDTASLERVFEALKTSPDVGLRGSEVEGRLRTFGYNEVAEPKRHPVFTLLSKFWGLSAWLLELILVVSLVLRRYLDFVVVSALLLLNAIVSFVQERRAAEVVAALRRRLSINARVRRDGSWRLVPARELVPGDIIRLRAGDFVPADARVFEGALGVDESALTGESVEAEREVGGRTYSGSLVRRGEASAVVISTGAGTYFGRTAQLVQVARPKLHVEELVAAVVRRLFVIVAALLAVVLVVAVVRRVGGLEILPLILVLLLSAVPVALPVMFTVSTAVGAMKLAKQHVLVTRFSAAEDAAVMDVLCVDKTGTITMNRLAVSGVIPRDGLVAEDLLFYAALASEEANQDPIDLAILTAARQRDVLSRRHAAAISFTPFTPETRRTEGVVELDGKRVRVVKGAVAAVAQACRLDSASVQALERQVAEAAADGYRAIAVAAGPADAALRPLGIVTLYDPPRPDARDLVIALRKLGVAVKVLTGDALAIASQIARSVGLTTVRRAAELKHAFGETAAAAAELARDTDGFAEVYPEDKYVVVKSLQAAGHVVGMTGDGVNDAPALRQAEVGIAVTNATDIAKGAASVVLTEEGLPGIVALVQQSRAVYQRVLTWIINKISRTILKAAYVAVAFLLTGRFVVSALGMIVLVFTSDFAKIALATDTVRWSKQPERWDITGPVRLAVLLGVLLLVEALGLLAVGWRNLALAENPAALNTFSFQALLYLGTFSVLSIRERRRFWASRPSWAMLAAVSFEACVATALPLVGIPGFPRLPWTQTLFVFLYAMTFALFVNDAVKERWVRRHAPAWLH
jgi:plasma-membrane proton-efflux P-type ATPase